MQSVTSMRKLHLDTDLGGDIDDLCALAMVLNWPAVELVGVTTVSDDGGSSGRLRDELQMLPPGDIRNCMIALSEDSTLLSQLFRHRFRGTGELGGHSFGNLFLAALTEVTGDFTEAVRLSSEVLASKGHIFPSTFPSSTLSIPPSAGTATMRHTAASPTTARNFTLLSPKSIAASRC